MTSVIISFTSNDSEPALYLASQLRASGIDVFIDYQRVMNGHVYLPRLEKEIASRGNFVFIQSPESLKDSLCRHELTFAHKHGANIIPVILRGSTPDDRNSVRFLRYLDSISMIHWKARGIFDVVQKLRSRIVSDQDESVISSQNLDKLQMITSLDANESRVQLVAVSDDDRLLLTTNRAMLKIWDLKRSDVQGSVHLLTNVEAHQGLIWGAKFLKDKSLIATVSADRTIRFWELYDLPEVYEYARIETGQPNYSVAYLPDEQVLAVGSHDNCVYLYDLSDLNHTRQIRKIGTLFHVGPVYAVTVSPDGNTIASASRDSVVRLWNFDRKLIETGAIFRPKNLRGHRNWVEALSFSKNGSLLASGAADGNICIWDTSHHEMAAQLEGHTNVVTAVTFSPDSSLLASGSRDNSIRIWDMRSMNCVSVLESHEDSVNSLQFSNNGDHLISGSSDGNVKIWAIAQRCEV